MPFRFVCKYIPFLYHRAAIQDTDAALRLIGVIRLLNDQIALIRKMKGIRTVLSSCRNGAPPECQCIRIKQAQISLTQKTGRKEDLILSGAIPGGVLIVSRNIFRQLFRTFHTDQFILFYFIYRMSAVDRIQQDISVVDIDRPDGIPEVLRLTGRFR